MCGKTIDMLDEANKEAAMILTKILTHGDVVLLSVGGQGLVGAAVVVDLSDIVDAVNEVPAVVEKDNSSVDTKEKLRVRSLSLKVPARN